MQGGLLAAVDEGSGGDSLGGDKGLFADFVAVRVTEVDDGERGTSGDERQHGHRVVDSM